ncbi:GNAT family N-acetyltransferase [Phyllobacterium myrsinacearum]|uniref:GNAT family N-acetyltransferase n=1 Tax=Phyllobacterium myrsinacearum TaxID=28101 RepID=A0A839ERT6_9HYPH|nr:GNAT family N-acetyltransferase [Phyllobacterium myrsinacearum]MBA8881522.1 hypothetical protein [Phyllobacterium myrsinacearum]
MTVEDIPQVGRLFYKIFRKKTGDSSTAFNNYFKDLFFGSPFYEIQYGSFVHETENGSINSAILAIPMQYSVDDRIVTARLLCAFMTDPDMSRRGAAELALTMRPRHQDLCFSDSASPVSADHWKAVGGTLMPLHGLDWYRVFQPAGFLAQTGGKHSAFLRFTARLPLARPADRLVKRMVASFNTEHTHGMHDETMSSELFLATVPEFLAPYSVRPVWSELELGWILGIARQNSSLGPLHIRSVWDSKAELNGCFVYFGQPGSIAQIMNVFSQKNKEHTVVNQMMYHLEQSGFVGARGHVQPRQLEALSRHRGMFYKHRAHTCVSTRYSSVTDAIARNEMFIGGLAGESWSRLVSDFF